MPFIHGMVDIASDVVFGELCHVWSFAVICQGVRIGSGCVVGSHAFVGRETRIGNDVRIQDGAHLTDRMIIEDGVFIGARVVIGNDRYPKVNNHTYTVEPPYIEMAAALGNGCNILPGVRIGHHALIGAGAVVTKDVPPWAVVVGNPACILRYRHADGV